MTMSGLKDTNANCNHLLNNWTKYLVQCKISTGFTGPAYSGKVEYMHDSLDYFNPSRAVEVVGEISANALQEKYPHLNIILKNEIQFLNPGEEPNVSMIHETRSLYIDEVASDPIAAQLIMGGLTRYDYAFFLHHAFTPEDLIYSLRNSCMRTLDFGCVSTAEEAILLLVKCNLRFQCSALGERYLQFAVEYVPNYISGEFNGFTTNKLFHYDLATHTYIPDNPPSPDLIKLMLSRLSISEQEFFLDWVADSWGIRAV